MRINRCDTRDVMHTRVRTYNTNTNIHVCFYAHKSTFDLFAGLFATGIGAAGADLVAVVVVMTVVEDLEDAAAASAVEVSAAARANSPERGFASLAGT
jgi:hypothetical protein